MRNAPAYFALGLMQRLVDLYGKCALYQPNTGTVGFVFPKYDDGKPSILTY